jgi:hypothetical protein
MSIEQLMSVERAAGFAMALDDCDGDALTGAVPHISSSETIPIDVRCLGPSSKAIVISGTTAAKSDALSQLAEQARAQQIRNYITMWWAGRATA